MDVIALYDIHGNIDALDAVLADPLLDDPDVVLVGGDAVPRPFGAATLDRLEALLADVRLIRGNGEREVAAAIVAPPAADDDIAAVTAAITARQLGEARSRAR